MHYSFFEKNSEGYQKRFRAKKIGNIFLSLLIFLLGASSLIISLLSDAKGNLLLEMRYMTINGTLFTTLLAIPVVWINWREIRMGTEMKSDVFYYLRLSSVVTEGIIALVIFLSFLPFVPDSPDIFKYDSFCMHVIIPLLSVFSFVLSDPPDIRRVPLMCLSGTWFITVYAIIVVTLITSGVMAKKHIPYSFLEINSRPLWYVLIAAGIVYAAAYLLTWIFSRWNHKLSSIWFRAS